MSDLQAVAVDEAMYRLDEVTPTEAPAGGEGSWYRYVIVQGTNVITGVRAGTLAELNPVLNEMVTRLNERAGRVRLKPKK